MRELRFEFDSGWGGRILLLDLHKSICTSSEMMVSL